MSTAGGPRLAGIGRSGDSDIVMCVDAHDAGSYGGEPTVNLFPQPSLASASVGTTWSGSNGSWGTSTATVESVLGPDGKYIKAVSNQHTANGGGTPNIWFFYHYLSGMGSAQRDLTLTNGTAYTCSWWWKATDSRTASSNNIYFTSPNVSTSTSNAVTTEWTKAYVYFTFGGTTGTYKPGHYFYSVVDDFKVWYAMLQIEEKTYGTPAVRNQLSGFGQQGYNARPASVNLSLNDGSYDDKSPNKLALTNTSTTMPGLGGKLGGAAYYFNASSYLKYTIPSGSSALFGTGNYTIDFWHYMPAGTSLKNYATWFSTYTSGYNSGIIIAEHATSGTYGVWNGSWLNTGVTILTDQWAHVAIVREGTGTNESTYYLNGTSIMTFTSSFDFVTATIKEFIVGSLYTASHAYGLEGYMSDVRVCSGTALWTHPFTPPTRSGDNAPVVDLSGNHNGGNFNTTDMTDVATYRDGQVIEPVGSAIWDFDNTDDVITLGPSSGFGISDTVSVFAWVKLDSTSGWNGVFGTYSGGNFIHFQIYIGRMNVYLYGATAAYDGDDAASYLSAGEWSHVGFTFGSDTLTVYVHGEEMPTQKSGNGNPVSTTTAVSIGRVYSSGRMFNGQMGNVQVYNARLTAQQVKENFNAQRSRFGV